MLLKSQLLKLAKKVDTNLEHKKISIQLATPRSIITFYLGYQLYIKFIDHQIRKQISVQTKSLDSYIELFLSSEKYNFLIDYGMPCFGFFTSAWAYLQSKNSFWIAGGSLYLGMLAYDYFLVQPVKESLLKDYAEDVRFMTEKKQMQKTQTRFTVIRKLTNLLNGKICLSLITILLLYIAQFKHSEQVDVKLDFKK